jgi:cell division septation protein DedD
MQARRARETAAAAAAAGTTKTTVDESELLSKLGKLKLDQSCPAKTPTQSPPSMQLQEDHPKDTKDKPQHKVRGRGKCTFSKYSADTDKRNENLD